ncbi:hypothetical protein SAMN05421639_101713 [Chryseobacterium shigense]|uniref:Uncharacterized protein n=1 Tax=Chryseobacterium shigense TaxID=297244 RepID=A0A1N7HZ25_9FLAO|nr:hypothetical protein [Chryseobacterium shigense]SIS30105.1 hypothetical protein SAMN05421639_101713 [Chryseobacterium shigense]
MKKVIFSVFMLFGVFCFSQTATKKYNSFYNRYEYFDSNGNMTGYEKYNSFSKQYEYYSTNNSQSPQTRQPTQYRAPQQLNIVNIGDSMNILQNRYNNNVQQVQSTINNIESQIKNLDISDSQKTKIQNNFSELLVKNVFEKNWNYNSVSEVNRIINWMYETANIIIKNVTSE